MWAAAAGGALVRTDSTVRRAPVVRARLDNELGEWSLVRTRWASADSAFSHALAAEHQFANQPDQADSQVAAGLTFVRFTLQVARARRANGATAPLRSSVAGLRDSVLALIRRLPPPRSDSAARFGARTRPDSEAAQLSLAYDHVANDLVTAHDTASLLQVLNDEMTIDSTLATRYPDRTALQDLAYTTNRRKQARLDAHHYADGAAGYADLVAVRRRLAHLPDASHRDTVNLASALGGQAWALLLAHRPAEALTAANEALRVDPTQLFIRTNQAHALLLTGRYDEAMQIYRTYWLRPISTDQTFGAAILGDAHTTGDFRDLAAAGVTDPALARAAADLRREFPKT
jgi:tetratricopeptide (TPR) repeat protein